MATIRQKQAFKEVVNGSSLTKAMVKANYSLETAKRTNKLTRTKGWQELMEKFLPDKELARVHQEGLNAGKTIYKNNVTSGEVEEVGYEPDYATRHKYLDSAYKIKGKYPKDTQEGNKTLVLIVSGESATRYNVQPNTIPENSST